MRIDRKNRALFAGAIGSGVAAGLLSDSIAQTIVVGALLLMSIVMISWAVTQDSLPRPEKHRHTFGKWETAWYRNENGTKAGVAQQIRECSECGLIEKRKP